MFKFTPEDCNLIMDQCSSSDSYDKDINFIEGLINKKLAWVSIKERKPTKEDGLSKCPFDSYDGHVLFITKDDGVLLQSWRFVPEGCVAWLGIPEYFVPKVDKDREEFEEMVKDDFPYSSLSKDEKGEYLDVCVFSAWTGFRMGRKSKENS